jgi:hypothetical protein
LFPIKEIPILPAHKKLRVQQTRNIAAFSK